MKRIDEIRKRKPTRSWPLMYVAFVATLGLLWLERRSSLTPTDHTLALLTIVLVFFVLTWMWLGAEDKR